MTFQCSYVPRAGALVVVAMTGKLDSAAAPVCETKLNEALALSPRVLMLDLALLEYISSLGLRTILKTRKAVEANGGSVVMANLQPQIAKVFEIASVLPKEAIFASIEEADQYLDAMQRKELEKHGRPHTL